MPAPAQRQRSPSKGKPGRPSKHDAFAPAPAKAAAGKDSKGSSKEDRRHTIAALQQDDPLSDEEELGSDDFQPLKARAAAAGKRKSVPALLAPAAVAPQQAPGRAKGGSKKTKSAPDPPLPVSEEEEEEEGEVQPEAEAPAGDASHAGHWCFQSLRARTTLCCSACHAS